ncbi:octaprenyl diphosphate synthase [Francisellaceae bacterium]|nr:octaprenyl diphosphate synthase [Francisellaceae bacterium]
MTLTEIKSLMANDIKVTDKLITEQLHSDVVLINQIGHYIINSGGKRIRPLLTLLCARALDYKSAHHHTLAAIIEFIHTATLLHDDVVDHSDLRRGEKTANNVFGNAASVLTGDFLYSRSFQMMVSINNMRIMNILADATNKIAEGEVLQLLNCNNPDTTEKDYYNVIYCKTAKLFEAACQLAAVVTKSDEKIEKALINYGKHLGNAFQLADDILDYTSSAEEMGKNIGDDLAEGKPTLPLIFALEHGTDKQKALISGAIKNADTTHIQEIIDIVKNSGGVEYTLDAANKASRDAIDSLSILPESQYKESLISLSKLAVERKS